jgi:hypothetical protein
MSLTIVQKINFLITKYHNPSLVNRKESPNGNRIYHIYDDGKITNQKGSYAYLQRNEFVNFYSIPNININLKLLLNFPIQNHDNEYYAIVDEKHAIEIRKLMVTYI